MEEYKDLGTTMRDGAGGAGCVVILAILLLVFFALGGGFETDAAPTITPTLDNDAALVHEVGQIVRPVVEAAADAVRADTQTAHATSTPVPPSEMVQLGRAWGWPGAFALVSCGSIAALAAVAVAWIWSKRPVAPQEPAPESEPVTGGVIVHNGTAPDEE